MAFLNVVKPSKFWHKNAFQHIYIMGDGWQKRDFLKKTAEFRKKIAKPIDNRKKMCYNKPSVAKPEVFVGVARAYMGVTRTYVIEQRRRGKAANLNK